VEGGDVVLGGHGSTMEFEQLGMPRVAEESLHFLTVTYGV